MTKHIAVELSLHQRRRSPTALELQAIPWLSLLSAQEHLRACAALQVGEALPGDYDLLVWLDRRAVEDEQ
jgi:CRP/FNR family transcriptional regulator, cyclic AMP receptor protein